MTKLVLMIILGLSAAMYFPDSRQMLLDTAAPVINPVLGWQTEGEIEKIIRDLRTHEQEHYNRLPDRREWRDWLARTYHGKVVEDSWGQPYHFLTQRDSFYVVSYGPDRTYGTIDDIRRGGVRANARR